MRASKSDLHVVDRLPKALAVRDVSLTVSISGDLTVDSAPLMRLHLLSLACEGGPCEIIVDLSEVSAIHRAGLAPLVEAHRLQLLRGGVLRLGPVSMPVARLLRSQPRIEHILTSLHGPVIRSLLDEDVDDLEKFSAETIQIAGTEPDFPSGRGDL